MSKHSNNKKTLKNNSSKLKQTKWQRLMAIILVFVMIGSMLIGGILGMVM